MDIFVVILSNKFSRHADLRHVNVSFAGNRVDPNHEKLIPHFKFLSDSEQEKAAKLVLYLVLSENNNGSL